MKKMMYTGLVLFISCVMTTAWTTKGKDQPATQASYSAQSDEETIIYITAEGYDNPSAWVGKTQPVTWINLDANVHTVTHDFGEFDSGPMKQGDRFTISFPHAGTWTYHDEYSKATAEINVMGRDE